MNLVFNLDNVICTPAKGIKFGMADYIKNVLPIEDTTEFMQWCKQQGFGCESSHRGMVRNESSSIR